jgi:hypothetical protein
VLDEWFIEQIQPLLKGESFIIRFADDFLLGFTHKEDADGVMKVLPKRLGKYGLKLHPEKTRLIDLDAREGAEKHEKKTFDFLGFTHFIGKSRNGKRILKRKTSGKKLNAALKRTEEWIRDNRHKMTITELIKGLNAKLRGHYGYYGITFNRRGIGSYYRQTLRKLQKWLNRRGGEKVWTWTRFIKLTNEWIPLEKPRIYHSYALAKP